MNNSKYLCSNNIINKFGGKNCYVYGCGGDGREFFNEFNSRVFIRAFIDSNNEGELFGIPILSNEICLDKEVKGSIVIATYKYEEDIESWLEKNGLEAGRDFYIWDRYMYNDTTDEYLMRYIEWNEYAWKKYEGETGNRRILMAAMDCEGFRSILYGYLSELLCNKFEAEPEAYISFRFDYKYEGLADDPYGTFGFHKLGELSQAVYKGFGVKIIHEAYPDDTQIIEAKKISEEVWSSIDSYADWKDIYVKGINFGTTIIRCMNRFLLPCIDPKDIRLKAFLERCIEYIIYWIDQFDKFDYKAVLLRDGVSYDGFIRDIAVKRGIPAILVHFYGIQKVGLNFAWYKQYMYFDKFWEMLDEEEKKKGIVIGKELLFHHLELMESNSKMKQNNDLMLNLLKSTKRIKIAVFVHGFFEDQYVYGDQVFDNNVFSWLCHLGELSEKTPTYEWYIKAHPHIKNSWRDSKILTMITEKYKSLKILPTSMSPHQIKEYGINYILTVYGDVGSEYPALGIKVITAGDNPYDSFRFTINPKTKEEFDNLIFNLENDNSKIEIEDMYKYWAINKLYYDWDFFSPNLFEQEELINKINENISGNTYPDWDYKMLLDNLSTEVHDRNRDKIRIAWERALNQKVEFFYKRKKIPADLWADALMTRSH